MVKGKSTKRKKSKTKSKTRKKPKLSSKMLKAKKQAKKEWMSIEAKRMRHIARFGHDKNFPLDREQELAMRKFRAYSKGKKLSKSQKTFRIRHTDMDYDDTKDVVQAFRADQKVSVKDIQRLNHISDYEIYKIEGTDGSEWYLVRDDDDLKEHAKADVASTWGSYEESSEIFRDMIKQHTDSKGNIDEDGALSDFVDHYGESEFLSGVDGQMYATGDGKLYYLYNEASR